MIKAYETQAEFIEKNGGRFILMASRALARIARSPEDYAKVYGHILTHARDKVVLHWLGDMFDPQLKGYWGSDKFEDALDTVIGIIEANRDKVEGIKISLLEERYEIALRNRLPDGVLCFTGDDFNYAPLIEGDGNKHSHALLGIFDAVAPQASSALAALADGDNARFRAIIEPTVPLSRKIFEAPTQYYKAGVVFLARSMDTKAISPCPPECNRHAVSCIMPIFSPRGSGKCSRSSGNCPYPHENSSGGLRLKLTAEKKNGSS